VRSTMSEKSMHCDRCGQPHATSKGGSSCRGHRRDGSPCTNPPMQAQRVCRMHGGKSPGAVEKAAERQASAAAEKAIGDLVPLLAGADPVKDPVDLLARILRVLEQMADSVAGRVNALGGKVGTGEHLARLRAEVVLLDKLQDRIVRGAGKLADLGIAERQVELAAGQADIVVAAVRAGLAALGPELLPDQRDVFLRAFLEHLVGAGGISPPELGEAS